MDAKDLKPQRLLLTSPRRLEWIAEKLPLLGAHEVLIQTRTGAISIGSELPVYCGTARTSKPLSYPRMTGYESVGIVTACGSEVKTVQAGDRVVSFYGHCTHAVVPEAKVIKIPDTISDPLAILTILTCDAAKGVRKLAPMPEERALITGAGAMGLLTLFILKAYGVTAVDVVEPRQERHALASQLGASSVYFPHDLPSASESYSIAFECSSRNEACALMQNQMQQHGRICILADGNLEPLMLTPAFHERELHIVGSSDGWDYQKHATWYFQTIQQNETGLEQIFEEEIARNELITTFERLAEERSRPVKVLVHYET
jgi:alcohol dehydrogenase